MKRPLTRSELSLDVRFAAMTRPRAEGISLSHGDRVLPVKSCKTQQGLTTAPGHIHHARDWVWGMGACVCCNTRVHTMV